MTWTLSGLWVFLTYAAGLLAMTSVSIENSFSHYHYFCLILGSLFWVIGFLIEVISDHQKKVFRRNESNKGKFIKTGLWAWSRHPNYFGNACIWWGIWLVACNSNLGWTTILSPLLMTLLLTRISGRDLLERQMKQRSAYASYIEKTNSFISWFPK